jgi:hypothetical protein
VPKKLPPQGGEPIRGGGTPNKTQNGYSGRIPDASLREINRELHGVLNGDVSLVFFVKDGRLSRFETRAWRCAYSKTSGFSGRFPVEAFRTLEAKITGLLHGTVEVSLAICDGRFVNCMTSVIKSFVPGKTTTGGYDGN